MKKSLRQATLNGILAAAISASPHSTVADCNHRHHIEPDAILGGKYAKLR